MDPERRAPRISHAARFESGTWSGQVVDFSAVGLRVRTAGRPALGAVVDAIIWFRESHPVQIRARVVRCALGLSSQEVGLELVEASKDFFDQLPLSVTDLS